MNKRRVVITGMGAVTPIGNNVQELWEGLIAGRNGAGKITKFDASIFATQFACEVKNFDPAVYIDKKELKRMDIYSQFALASAAMAIEDSKLDLSKINLNMAGVVFGSGIGGIQTFEEQHNLFLQGGPKRVSPFFVPNDDTRYCCRSYFN